MNATVSKFVSHLGFSNGCPPGLFVKEERYWGPVPGRAEESRKSSPFGYLTAFTTRSILILSQLLMVGGVPPVPAFGVNSDF